ncbi:leucine-rich repeat domain-containing protein, partial [bacterium]|nr:leucine-rich repeat domain-containing protein [bacterium]
MLTATFIYDKKSDQYKLLIEGQRLFKTIHYRGKKYLLVKDQETANQIDTLLVDAPYYEKNKLYKLPNLKNVTILNGNRTFLRTLAGTKVEHVEMAADGQVSQYSLHGCAELKSVVFPKRVCEIPSGICQFASNLTSVKLGEVEYFMDYCFYKCEKLTVDIPKSVKHICRYAMWGTANSKVVVPRNCNQVEAYTFGNMKNLTEVVFENHYVRIDPTTFDNC